MYELGFFKEYKSLYLDFNHETLCCYDLFLHLNSLLDACSGPDCRLQFLHSSNRIPSCMELIRSLGFNCFVHEAFRDLSQTGHYESYLIYYFQFPYNFIEGTLPLSIRTIAAPNSKYEIGWPHEVSVNLAIFILMGFSAITLCSI